MFQPARLNERTVFQLLMLTSQTASDNTAVAIAGAEDASDWK
jgi:hypothetical protein